MIKKYIFVVEVNESNGHFRNFEIVATSYEVGISGHVDFFDMIEIDPELIEPNEKLLANGKLFRKIKVLTYSAGQWNKVKKEF